MALPVILTSADDPAIRAMVRSDLSEGELPDVIIEMSFGPATRQVVAIDPLAGTWPVGSDEAQNDHAAAILFSAAWLVPTVPLVIRETFQGYSYGLAEGMPIADRIQWLKQSAQSVLAGNLDETLIELMMPTMFTLAQANRGGVDDAANAPAVPGLTGPT